MNKVNFKSLINEITKYVSTILLMIVLGVSIIAIIVFMLYQHSLKEEFNQNASVIQPIYTRIQEKYNHNVILKEAKSMGIKYYTFEYKEDLKNAIVTNQNLCEISSIIFLDILNYIQANKDLNFMKHGYSISFIIDEQYIDFSNNYDDDDKKIKIHTNTIIDLNSLSKIKNLCDIDADFNKYPINEIRKIKEWCIKRGVKLNNKDSNLISIPVN